MTEYIQVMTTLAERGDAEQLATVLVRDRLAACVQILGPMTSVYRWQDKVENSEEYLLVAKTGRDVYQEMEKVIRERHPYEVPEILALPIVAGAESYLAWLGRELKHG